MLVHDLGRAFSILAVTALALGIGGFAFPNAVDSMTALRSE
jgi:hypothetical protein